MAKRIPIMLDITLRDPSQSGHHNPEGFFHVVVTPRVALSYEEAMAQDLYIPGIVKNANGIDIDHLVYDFQGHRDSATVYSSGWTYDELRGMDLLCAERKVKTLRLLKRRSEKLTAQHGYTRDFDQMVRHFAQIVKATEVQFHLSTNAMFGATPEIKRLTERKRPLTSMTYELSTFERFALGKYGKKEAA